MYFVWENILLEYRDGMQIGESAMVVIDSMPGKYEKVEVTGKRVVK